VKYRISAEDKGIGGGAPAFSDFFSILLQTNAFLDVSANILSKSS